MGDGEAHGGASERGTEQESVAVDAGAAILTALRAMGERMSQLEPAVLADEPDAVHQLRTNVRRLRSLLAAYGPLFDAAVATALRRRYRTFGRELGVVRDLEVRVQVAERALAEAAEEGVLADAEERDEVQARLIDTERDVARPRACASRGTGALAACRSAPGRAAGVPRRSAAHGARRRARGAGARGAARAGGATRGASQRAARRSSRHRDAARVRKAGRRLRYAAEAVSTEPVELFDGRAARAGVGRRRPARPARRPPRRGAVRRARAARRRARRARGRARRRRSSGWRPRRTPAPRRSSTHLRR